MEELLKALFLTRRDVESVFTMKDAIDAMEDAFKAHGEKKVAQPPKTIIPIPKHDGEVAAMPGYVETVDAVGIKLTVGYWKNPERYNLPSVLGILIVSDAKNGAPLALMDSSYVTAMRTGGAAALAAKHLARPDSRVAAIIGAGAQARTQLIGLAQVYKLNEARVTDIITQRSREYAREMTAKLGLKVSVLDDPEKAVKGSDIVACATPSTKPVVMADWITEGMHVTSIGSDAPDKNEVDPRLLGKAKVVVDDWPQTSGTGTFKKALAEGVIKEKDVHGELGEIVAGKKKGRTSPSEITAYFASGLAIQDIVSAMKIYTLAKQKGVGAEVVIME